jgi:hypothetical protein
MRVRQEEDLMAGRAITVVAVAVLLLTLAMCFWAAQLLAGYEHAQRPSLRFPEARLPRPTEASDIEQETFGRVPQARIDREQQRRRLHGFGWVERERGVVHVPIDRAIDLYVAEHAP